MQIFHDERKYFIILLNMNHLDMLKYTGCLLTEMTEIFKVSLQYELITYSDYTVYVLLGFLL